MKLVNLSIAAAAACMFATSAYALKSGDRNVKDNYQVEYTKLPGAVNSFSEMISEGEVYGRLRSNAFLWEWETESSAVQDNDMWGLGGSLVAKTGFYHGLGATVGFYGTTQVLDDNKYPGSTTNNYGKAGKDTYRTRRNGTEANIGVFAEAFLEYKAGKTNVKVGRQGIDSIMIATNDTKMVPNTFEAAVVENSDVPNTKLRAGYIKSQKLRDHQEFHSVIAYDSASKVEQNDDSGVHKGLTIANIRTRSNGDLDPHMILATAENTSIPNLKLNAEYIGLDGFFNTVIAEANYKIKLSDAWSLTPGIRYLSQMDDGAGRIGGAALSGTLANTTGAGNGYTDRGNADGSIIMARLVAANGPLELSAGYSKVSDDADIIAPWRGFPTDGYTRSMAQVDWIANTENWAVKAVYDFDKAGIISGLKIAADYEHMNFDNSKAATSTFTDRDIIHVDAWQTFKAVPNTEFKFRFATIDSDPAVGAAIDTNSYNEYRFEINYLF